MAHILDSGDIVEVILWAKQKEQVSMNVLHYLVASNVGSYTLDHETATVLAGLFTPEYTALLNEQAVYHGITVRWIPFDTPPPPMILSDFVGAPGVIEGDPLPLQTCGLITHHTDLAGRTGQGRSYIPFPSENSSGVSATPLLDYVSALEDLAEQMNGGGFAGIPLTRDLGANSVLLSLGVLSRQSGGPTIQQVSSQRYKQKWATMRSRGDYGKQNRSPWE